MLFVLKLSLLSFLMLSVHSPYAECSNVECTYADCVYVECLYVVRPYAECLHAECHYALVIMLIVIFHCWS
jgi:hypothetical protein